jgi:hypothetical protein
MTPEYHKINMEEDNRVEFAQFLLAARKNLSHGI